MSVVETSKSDRPREMVGRLRPKDHSVGLACKEIWGGNRPFFGPVELPGLKGVLYSQPCEGSRGGDVHYLSVCGSGLLSRVCLADVVGHGESVAAVSEVMHKLLRQSVDRVDERKVLRRLNLRLARLGNDSFTTAAALTYFPPTRRMSISYAGHEPAWYYDASKRRWSMLEPVERKGLANLILAVSPKARFTRCVRRVANGDRVLMITDGLLEAPNKAGKLFGREALTRVIQTAESSSPETVVDSILESLSNHTGGVGLNHDDVSILLLEFVDNLEKPALWTALQNRLFRRRPPKEALPVACQAINS